MSLILSSDTIGVPVKYWQFPGGERGVRIEGNVLDHPVIEMVYSGSNDLVDLMLLVNAIRHNFGNKTIQLICKYFPFARQDRVCNTGESFSLQAIAQFINMLNFSKIEVWDPHSDVLAGMFPPGVLKVTEQYLLAVTHLGALDTIDLIVAPDAGAAKKANKLAFAIGCHIVHASKTRRPMDGLVCDINFDADVKKMNRIVVVDDIYDGGATFIALGERIRKDFSGQLDLFTTHGIYSKGQVALATYYNNIKTANYIGA